MSSAQYYPSFVLQSALLSLLDDVEALGSRLCQLVGYDHTSSATHDRHDGTRETSPPSPSTSQLSHSSRSSRFSRNSAIFQNEPALVTAPHCPDVMHPHCSPHASMSSPAFSSHHAFYLGKGNGGWKGPVNHGAHSHPRIIRTAPDKRNRAYRRREERKKRKIEERQVRTQAENEEEEEEQEEEGEEGEAEQQEERAEEEDGEREDKEDESESVKEGSSQHTD